MLISSIIVQGIVLIAFLEGGVMMIYDWRYKAIPLYLLLPFAGLSLIYGGIMHANWQSLGIVMAVTFILLLYFVNRKRLGLADAILIPCCLAWIEIDQIPLFLILCGTLGVITSVFWQWLYGEKEYPFGPAILFSFMGLVTFS